MRKIFLIATTFLFCGGNAFAMYQSLPCVLSYEEYRKHLIRSGAIPIKCEGATFYWDELCKRGWRDRYPYAAWEVKGGVMTGVKPVRYEFPVRHPLTFHLADKFSKKKFKQGLCVKAEFFRVKDLVNSDK